MTTLAQAQAAVVARLTAGGVRATSDERNVNPPCVFVPAPAVVFRFGGRCWDATYVLVLVVPDAGRVANLTGLGDLIDQTQAALAGECTQAAPVSFPGVDGGPPLPGYALTYSQTVE